MTPAELALEGPAPLRGRLRPPGDKGISHRALLFAAMADGTSRLARLADGDDVARTRGTLTSLGVRIVGDEGSVVVHGAGVDALREPAHVLDCANSGTTMRMAVGLLAGRPFHTVLVGDDALSRRPMARVAGPVRLMGAHVDGREGGDYAPLAVRGGALTGCRHELTSASGQVKTALLLAGLQADGVTEIVEPAASRDHSERLLEALGVSLTRRDATTVQVRAGAPRSFELDVPGDVSSAAFFVIAAAITAGSELVVEDVGVNPTRLGFVDALARMGADVTVDVRETRLGEPVGDLTVRAARLHGAEVTVDEGFIDEVPALAVAAAFADGVTEFRGVGELRVKESDRLAALEQELTELGVGVEAGADRLVVRGGAPHATTLKSHGDHRIAMAAAVAANAVAGGSTVRGWAAVAVSYPGFADDLAALTRAR